MDLMNGHFDKTSKAVIYISVRPANQDMLVHTKLFREHEGKRRGVILLNVGDRLEGVSFREGGSSVKPPSSPRSVLASFRSFQDIHG